MILDEKAWLSVSCSFLFKEEEVRTLSTSSTPNSSIQVSMKLSLCTVMMEEEGATPLLGALIALQLVLEV